MILEMVRSDPHICEAPLLSSPAAVATTHHVSGMLGALQFLLLAPPLAHPLSPAEECRSVLIHLQLALGLVLPALAALALESWLFLQHERQRAALGLRPECGLAARAYRGIAAVGGVDRAFLGALLCALFNALQLLSVALALDPQQPAPA